MARVGEVLNDVGSMRWQSTPEDVVGSQWFSAQSSLSAAEQPVYHTDMLVALLAC